MVFWECLAEARRPAVVFSENCRRSALKWPVLSSFTNALLAWPGKKARKGHAPILLNDNVPSSPLEWPTMTIVFCSPQGLRAPTQPAPCESLPGKGAEAGCLLVFRRTAVAPR